MNGQPAFDDSELSLIQAAKRAMGILAKVIRDKDIREVVKDPDLAELIGDKTLEQALADPELGKKIRARVTPDLPQLNVEQEARVISQLGSVVFGQLLKIETDNQDGPH